MLAKKKYLFFLMVFLTPVLLFLKSFSAYFSQDDFFRLRASQISSLTEIGKFFSFSAIRGYAFYRPLPREVFSFMMWHLFGLNPFPYHLFQFFIYIFNLFLIDKLFSKLIDNNFKGKEKVRCLVIFLYVISAVNLGTFYYLSSLEILLAMTFILLTITCFITGKYLKSFLFCLLSLMCHEISYVSPVFLLVFTFVLRKNRPNLKTILPFFTVTFLTAWLNISQIRLPSQKEYLPEFSFLRPINNLFWYFIWSLGIPEHMLDFVGHGLKINPKIIRQYPLYFWTMSLTFSGLIAGLISSLISLLMNSFVKTLKGSTDKKFWRYLFLAVFWYLTGISFFLFFGSHRFIYYLIFSQVGTCFALALLISRLSLKSSLIVLILFFVLNFNTIKWGEKTYWALGRSRLAKKLTTEIKTAYPTFPKGAIIWLKDDPSYLSPGPDWGGTAKQAYIALSGSDGIQLLYNDFSLKVYYEGDLLPPKTDQVFEFKVKAF